MNSLSNAIVRRTRDFANQVDSLRFSCDCYIYNPLDYAWPMMETYIRRYLARPVKAVFLGMNPGPFGMAQTGIPFGEITVVKEYLRIEEEIGRPLVEHPKRPVLGLETRRREVSGQRLWGLIQEYFPDAAELVGAVGVINYCPL
ncbi:MAG: single-stranded DNA-binding protein, partial [Spirochaetales bacterium]|nr:single-stranded DNA-binding protein [Spirochaetales bacterium]